MDLAVPAFEDPPVGSRVAQVAGPLNQSAIRLDHFERVCAGVGDRHLCLAAGSVFGSVSGVCELDENSRFVANSLRPRPRGL